VADPIAKSVNPAGATGSVPAPAKAAPITSIDDLIEQAEDRLIPKGSTARVSPDNADVQSKGRVDELQDSLEACGIKLVWDRSVAKDAIVIERPAPKQPAPAAAGGKR
jgi:hypothetical protein